MRQGEIRFEPQEGTTEGYSDEDVVKFYESSLGRRDTNEPLLSIASKARGMRLTVEQASELHEWLGVWLAAVRDPAPPPAQPEPVPIRSDACPTCGTPGGRYATHVCMTAGTVPSFRPAPAESGEPE